MSVAAYKTGVKISGTATTFTTEAMVDVGAGTTWYMSNAAKAVWDLNTALTFYDNAVEIDAADIVEIDYLFGRVTFDSSLSGPVTVTGKYMPMASVAGAKSHSYDISTDVLDSTDYVAAIANGGYRTRKLGLLSAAFNLTRWDDLTQAFATLLASRARCLIEIRPGNGAYVIRAWCVPETVNFSGDVSALEEETLSFQLDGEQLPGVISAIGFYTELY